MLLYKRLKSQIKVIFPLLLVLWSQGTLASSDSDELKKDRYYDYRDSKKHKEHSKLIKIMTMTAQTQTQKKRAVSTIIKIIIMITPTQKRTKSTGKNIIKVTTIIALITKNTIQTVIKATIMIIKNIAMLKIKIKIKAQKLFPAQYKRHDKVSNTCIKSSQQMWIQRI